jgi:ATP-dependent Clp protease ATP-binding subunit ClpA
MVGWYLSEQARHALRTARTLARDRGDPAPGSADLLLAAILGQWDDEHAGGPALLRACGFTGEQASQLTAKLLPSASRTAGAAAPAAEPRLIGSLRFVVDQAYRIAAVARAPYVGTEHLVLAMLWQDTQTSAHELRRQGVSYARAAELLASLPHTEHVVTSGEIEPLETMEVPTPAVASLGELARQQAEQHPLDGRTSTLHYLLAVLSPGTAAFRLLRELGVDYRTLVERLTGEGARLVGEDDRRRELPVEGWEEFRVTDQQHEMIRGRVTDVLKELWPQGVRFGVGKRDDDPEWWLVKIHPGESGLDPRVVLDRMLGRVPSA